MILRTLGGLQLPGNTTPNSKLLLLICYLAIEGPQQRLHLSELFWPQATDRLNRLSVSLTRLRRVLPGAVETDRNRARTTLKSDVNLLLAALRSHDVEKIRRLYRGPFLEGVHLPNWGVELEEWVYGTRELLAGRVRMALIRTAEQAASEERFADAAQWAQEAYGLNGAPELDPEIMERVHVLLLAGGKSHAMEIERELKELDLASAPTTDAARKQLRNRLSSTVYASPNNLPRMSSAFIGRDAELAELRESLAAPNTPLLTLVGPPGVGKTRLATEAAAAQSKLGQFPDGVYFVSLDTLRSAASIPSRIAEAMGVSLQGSADPLKQLCRAIADKSILLVLDNFEHLLEGAGMTATLLQQCPNLRAVVTSRERLRVREERIFPLQGLPVPTGDAAVIGMQEVSAYDSLEFFLRRARHARPNYRATPEDLPDIVRVCQSVEGNPLAIELAAAWVNSLTCAEIADEIGRGLDLLHSTTRNVSARHQSLRAAFEYSWKLLQPKERNVLRKLSVFAGSFSRKAASDVAEATINVLAALIDKSLLRMLPDGRYDRHPLLHQFTKEKLAASPSEEARVSVRKARYFFDLFSHTGVDLTPPGPELLQLFAADAQDIEVAWQWALRNAGLFADGELQRVLQLFMWHYAAGGKHREGLAFYTSTAQTLNNTSKPNQVLLGLTLCLQADACHHLGRSREAAELAEQGLNVLYPSPADPPAAVEHVPAMLIGLAVRGLAAEKSGFYTEAKAAHEEALHLARLHGMPAPAIIRLNYLSNLEHALGNDDSAREHALKALTLSQSETFRFGEIYSLRCLSWIHLNSGNVEECLLLLGQGLKLARETDYQQLIPSFLIIRGTAALRLEDDAQARRFFSEALTLAQDAGYRTDEAMALLGFGYLLHRQGEYQQAKRHIKESLEVAWSNGEIPTAMRCLIALAELESEAGDFNEAVDWLHLALHHPATAYWDRRQAELILARQVHGPRADERFGARARDMHTSLEKAVEQVLS